MSEPKRLVHLRAYLASAVEDGSISGEGITAQLSELVAVVTIDMQTIGRDRARLKLAEGFRKLADRIGGK